ncbi:MAG: hypothetical protein QOH35_3053 [Acidobacteriaceae bacterium]|nr:hypothetical protein [Acidobacteriaceae bacterium]
MLKDDREVRLEMTLNLCGPGTLFDDLGKEHLPRNLKAAFAVRRKAPSSLVKRWRKPVTLACEDFPGFFIELLMIVRGDRFGRLSGQFTFSDDSANRTSTSCSCPGTAKTFTDLSVI